MVEARRDALSVRVWLLMECAIPGCNNPAGPSTVTAYFDLPATAKNLSHMKMTRKPARRERLNVRLCEHHGFRVIAQLHAIFGRKNFESLPLD